MTSPKGLPVNAVFGFTRDLFHILKTQQPTHWLCAMDSPGPGARDTIYPEYKANRSEMPEDLRSQILLTKQIMDGFGIPAIQVEGWEADDIIATLTRQATEMGWEVRIVTNDKDARQLLNPRVRLFNVRKNTWLDGADVVADWGVRPEQVIDFQSLVGDSVDNVPGVPLVGPKKAAALLEQFGTLEGVLVNADKVAGDKLKANLKQFADLARISRQLVTLNQHLSLTPDWNAMQTTFVDVAKLSRLCQDFGFRRFIEEARALPSEHKLPSSVDETTESVPSTNEADQPRRWDVVDSNVKLSEFIQQLERQTEFCLDVVASSPRAAEADILGLAFCWETGRSWFIPTDDPPENIPSNINDEPRARQRSLFDEPEESSHVRKNVGAHTLASVATEKDHLPGQRRREVLDRLRPILEAANIRVSNHDVKFDLVLLRQAGIHVRGLGLDPMLASYLLEAGARSHDLPALAEVHLLQAVSPFDPAMLGDRNRLAEWTTERVDLAWRLSQRLGEELRQSGLWDLYWDLERPLIGILAQIEATGIRVDVAELSGQSAELAVRLANLMTEIHQLAGHEFNIDSPKQLAKVLFEELGLPILKKLKTGPSTDQDVLENLALVHPLPAKIIEHRQLSKLKGTYLDALPTMVNPRTGKIHATFHQAVAATGRLSSAEPNLQNIPIRTAEGQRVRRAFIPSEAGWKFVAADYSQVELRMLAHFCGDAALCEAFASGIDIHTAVACEVFNVVPDAVTSEQRRIAKAVNFGVLYGQSPFGLAEALHIDQTEATMFIDQYFAKYAGVDKFIAQTMTKVAECGFATTILGRRRAISGVRPDRNRQLNLSERTAINTVIQGSAADLIKQAMIRVDDRLQRDKHPGRLLLQIHDELVFETPACEADSLSVLIREEMQNAMTLQVPLVVDLSSGDNWQEA